MSSELATQPTQPKGKNALMALSDRLSISPEKLKETLMKTVFKNCKNDEEFAVMVVVSNEYSLNPLTKQIYAFPAKGGGIEPIVSVDGWIKIINSQPHFDGMQIDIADDGSEATCTIHVKNRTHPTIITEYLDECKRNTDPWNQMPKRMLRNKVIIQAGRVAFGICGIYDEDEEQEVAMRNVTKANEPTKATQSGVAQLAPPKKSSDKAKAVEKTAETETERESPCKQELLERIKGKLDEAEITLLRFEAYLRKNNIMSVTQSLRGQDEKYLNNIAANMASFVDEIKGKENQ